MKNKTLLLSALAVFGGILFLASSCKKGGGPVAAPIGVIGTVGDSNFVSTSAQSYYDTSLNLFLVAGVSFRSYDSSNLSIQFPPPIRVNVPISSDSVDVLMGYSNTIQRITYIGGATPYKGHVIYEVTSWDSVNRKLQGTFSGTVYSVSQGSIGDSLVVTKGAFNVTYGGQH
jgi:hypothetical protein